MLNAPNSTVGRILLQLCKLLKLRTLALLRPNSSQKSSAGQDARFEVVAEQLQELGATLVLKDEGSVKVGVYTCAASLS